MSLLCQNLNIIVSLRNIGRMYFVSGVNIYRPEINMGMIIIRISFYLFHFLSSRRKYFSECMTFLTERDQQLCPRNKSSFRPLSVKFNLKYRKGEPVFSLLFERNDLIKTTFAFITFWKFLWKIDTTRSESILSPSYLWLFL